MGFLDSLFGSSTDSSKLTAQESFAGILLGASACDGHIAEEEVQGLVTTLIRMELYRRFTDRQYNQMLNKLHGFLKRRGVDELIDACVDSLPEQLDNAAFTNACDIVLADGVVEPDEKMFIDRLQQKLNIHPNKARMIVDVMVVKNRG